MGIRDMNDDERTVGMYILIFIAYYVVLYVLAYTKPSWILFLFAD